MPLRLCLVLLLVPVSFVAHAQDEPVTILVHTAEGQKIEGRLESLADGGLTLAGDKSPRKLSDLFRIEWPRQPVRVTISAPVLLFPNQDKLAIRPVRMTGEALFGTWVQFDAWPELRVPLEALRGCVFQPPATVAEQSRLFDQIMHPAPKSEAARADAVLLKNGDTLTGEYQSLDNAELHFKAAAGETRISLNNAVSLTFNPELTLVKQFKGEGAILSLIDGSRLHVSRLKVTPLRTLQCDTTFSKGLEVPLSSVAALQMIGGRVVPLSSLEPSADKSQPYLSLTWPYRRDRSVTGSPLRLRGVEYFTGLGVHSRSELTWKLDGKYRKFLATVGVDDETEGRGSVIFRVAVDGKPVWTSPTLTGRSDPVVLEPIDLSQAKTLTLMVEFATFGDVLDHADWCDARLVK